MAIIKSYTDLEQSRKLAEILPLESADMKYICIDICKGLKYMPEPRFIKNIPDHADEYDVNAWSLAALLELLPKRLQIVDNVYELSVYLYGLYYWNTINGNLCFESQDKDNLVDACVDMIEKLNELNLL